MTTEEFLQMVLNGYVTTYRKNNWHTTERHLANWTHKDLNFFIRLGESLGFIVQLEMNYEYPRDLCWCNGIKGDKPFLYLERENKDANAVDTIKRMFEPAANTQDIPILVAVFGEVTKETLQRVKNTVRLNVNENQCFLVISWPPENQDVNDDDIVEGWIFSRRQETRRIARANMDKGGYWFMYFDDKDKGWTAAATKARG
jgi:hypothetical protein